MERYANAYERTLMDLQNGKYATRSTFVRKLCTVQYEECQTYTLTGGLNPHTQTE